MKYEVKLHYALDYNVESALFSKGVNVIAGEIGDYSIIVESELATETILRECSVDVESIEIIKD